MPEAHDHRIGEIVLGKYQVQSVLGRGGMGVVYQAEDMRLGRHVAIKVLNAAARTRGDADQRFQLEARAIAALMHPHLVTLLDYDFLDDGTPCMVMERVEGVSLKHLMLRRSFTPLEVVVVLYQTLLALSACHAKGVIHRDLKPENLLVTRGGPQGITVKVIDFGLTKLLADAGATALTVNGQVFGSPRFMAPEQWLQKEVTGRTDLYALGLIGYCLLRGEHFISASNPFEICKAHLSQPRPPLRTTRDGTRVPTLLDTVLRRAADPDPRNRFDSAEAMLAALEPLTMDALSFTRFTGEQLTPAVTGDDSGGSPAPFDAAQMAASIDASLSAPEVDSLDMTQPGLEVRASAPPIGFDDGEDADEDHRTLAEPVEPAPADPMATLLLQPALQLNGDDSASMSAVVEVTPANRVKFAVSGGIFTAITKGDVERAMNDAAQAASESDPPRAVAPPPVGAPEPTPAVERVRGPEARRPTAQLTPVRTGVTDARRPPEPTNGRRTALLVAVGVLAAAGLGAAVAWFWM